MAEFEERKKFWRIFYSPLVFIILLVFFLLMARAMWRVYNHERVSERDRTRFEDELVAVNERQAVLKIQVEALGTQEGIENEIRAKFNVTKSGEGVAVIVNNASVTNATASPAVDQSMWQKLLGTFGL